MQVYDTIVVGMGAAGTTAAATLAKAGKRVLGLEAQDRVGGRVRTEKFGDGVVEVGAEWIHGQFPSRVYDLAIKNNITVLPQDLAFDVYRSDGTRTDTDLLMELMTYCIGTMENMSDKPESVAQLVTRKFKDYLKEHKPDLLNDTDFVNNFLDFMNLVVNNYESSNDWSDVSALSKYEELGGHQHMSWHRHGYKTFFEILLNKYNNGPGLPTLDIKLNKEVTNIKWPKDTTGDVIVTCKDGDQYTAHNVIVTVSLGVLKERYATMFTPPLPHDKITAIEKMSMGVIDKIILKFETSWFPFTQDSFIYLYWTKEDKNKLTADNKWMSTITGATKRIGADNILIVWTQGDPAKLTHNTLFSPLPQDKTSAIDTLSMGSLCKIILAFDSYSLPKAISLYWTAESRKKMAPEDNWMTKIVGISPPMGSSNTLTFWTVCCSSLFTPGLPPSKIRAIQTISIGVMDKIILSFDKEWWEKNSTFFGFLWRDQERQKIRKEDYWMTRIFGASMPMGSGHVLTLWTSGDTGKMIETLPEDVVKRKTVELLQMFMGANVTVPQPTAMLRSTWYSNPFTRGSYTYDNMEMPNHPDIRQDLAAPLLDSAGTPRVLFAGEATDNIHFSTVHGASDTGLREAKRLLPSSKI